jgi:3-oxoacyl-[acyl-carrier protein] reductase
MTKKPLIIISGSSGGIGSLLLKILLKKFNILCIYNKKKPKLFSPSKTLKIDFNKISKIEKSAAKLIKIISLEKKIIFLNIAGTKIDKISIDIKKNEINKSFNINYFSFFYLTQSILPILIKNKWGRIINFSSTGGLSGQIGTLLYTSSKYASLGMIKVMSKEYAKFNITFNTIRLGNFNTGMYRKLNDKTKENILKKIPSGKTGDIKSLYNAIEFIIRSNYVNGSEISVDGAYDAN